MESQDLENRIEKFKKYYYKGAGNLLCSIGSSAEGVVEPRYSSKDKKELLKTLKNSYKCYTDNYPNFDFDEIREDEDLFPLVVLDKLNTKLERKINEFVKNPTDDKAVNLHFLCNAICTVADVYRDSFEKTIADLRELPGHENYILEIIDYQGRKYSM